MDPETTISQQQLDQLALSIVQQLSKSSSCLVLAESCTAGLIAATLARIPGASMVLAGSAVVYQLETKTAWLKIAPALLREPGAVSRVVAEQMAVQVLECTPYATVSLSITGHLGPEAPAELDGVAWSAIADREGVVVARKFQLDAVPGGINHSIPPENGWDRVSVGVQRRRQRQTNAVFQALSFLRGQIFATS